jgi:putative NADH-flavin reductase
MKIVIFGAAGRVGQQLVKQAIADNYEVVAFVHRNNPFAESLKVLSVLQGDVSNAAMVLQAIKNVDVVMSALGSWHTKQKNILTSGMQAILPAMQASGVNRIITLTGSAARWSKDNYSLIDTCNHQLFKVMAPAILRDSEDHLKQLENSGLLWTCIRAPIMTNGTDTSYRLLHKPSSPLASIQRAAVVRAMLDQIQDKSKLSQAPIIYRK